MVFCCHSPSASRLDALNVQTRCSADLSWNKQVFELLLPFYHLQLVWTRSFQLHNCCSRDTLFLFSPLVVNPWDGFKKNPMDQQFLNYSRQPVWHQQPCHIHSQLYSRFPHSDAQVILQQVIFTTSRYLNTLSRCLVIDWLISCLCWQAVGQLDLTKEPVVVFNFLLGAVPSNLCVHVKRQVQPMLSWYFTKVSPQS